MGREKEPLRRSCQQGMARKVIKIDHHGVMTGSRALISSRINPRRFNSLSFLLPTIFFRMACNMRYLQIKNRFIDRRIHSLRLPEEASLPSR